jgi:hypothetical protein
VLVKASVRVSVAQNRFIDRVFEPNSVSDYCSDVSGSIEARPRSMATQDPG